MLLDHLIVKPCWAALHVQAVLGTWIRHAATPLETIVYFPLWLPYRIAVHCMWPAAEATLRRRNRIEEEKAQC